MGQTSLRIIVSVIFIAVAGIFIGEAWQQKLAADSEKIKYTLENADVYLEGDEISALLLTEDSLWVGGKDGIKSVDYITGEVLGYVVDDIELIYAAEIIISSRDDSIWIGHNDGVTVLHTNGDRVDFKAPEMSGGRSNAILETEQGIYVGTMQGCTLFGYSDDVWSIVEIYDNTNGLAASPVNVLVEINQEIWFGSYLDSNPGGVSILNLENNTFQYLDIENGLPHPYINAILPMDESVYVATGQLTFGGLAKTEVIDGVHTVVDTFTTDDNIPGEKVRQLYQDDLGFIWITTESNGLILAKDISCIGHPIIGVVADEDNGLSDNEIKCIVETDTHYWLGGRYGLTRILKDEIVDLLDKEQAYGE